MTAKTTEGAEIAVSFDSQRCIHSRNCVLGLPGVFEANAPGEWIHPDAASAEEIADLVSICPSGALGYRLKTGKQEQPPQVNTIRVRENGPLAVHAQIELDGQAVLRATLCRCGASKNKPFCDGSHKSENFVATGEPETKDATALQARDGVLKITSQPDGNLKVEGNVEIVCGTGRIVERATKTWLCRCGASKNKPFCDGSHKAIGFKA